MTGLVLLSFNFLLLYSVSEIHLLLDGETPLRSDGSASGPGAGEESGGQREGEPRPLQTNPP